MTQTKNRVKAEIVGLKADKPGKLFTLQTLYFDRLIDALDIPEDNTTWVSVTNDRGDLVMTRRTDGVWVGRDNKPLIGVCGKTIKS